MVGVLQAARHTPQLGAAVQGDGQHQNAAALRAGELQLLQQHVQLCSRAAACAREGHFGSASELARIILVAAEQCCVQMRGRVSVQ